MARKGLVLAAAMERTKAAILQRVVHETVADDVSLVATMKRRATVD